MIRITIDVDFVTIYNKLFNFFIVVWFLFLVYQSNEAYEVLTMLRDFCFIYKLFVHHTY